MITPAHLRARAEDQAATLPPLLARAEQLAGSVLLGEHGRRRSGLGDDFWQYRPFQTGDSQRMIDWRRSALGDAQYVREREWQIAQSVVLWVDQATSMTYQSHKNLPEKLDRARVLGLAIAILLVRGGERVGLAGTRLPPRRGNNQILRLAEFFSQNDSEDYNTPETRAMIPQTRAVFISDFLSDFDATKSALLKAADRGVRGALLQVLDPSEEAFPFTGRTIFESASRTVQHETLKANDLKDRYVERLAARKDALNDLCRTTGWQFQTHHTDQSPMTGLLWLWEAINRGTA